jgi:hypothetical protein
VDSVGKIPLADVTLVEDPAEDERNDDGKRDRDFLNHISNKIRGGGCKNSEEIKLCP